MTEINVREKYRDLINDIDFDKLELQLKTPNIFQILGVARTEIRHSNFLGWMLDPNGNHGLGKLFLTKFLRGITTSEIATQLDREPNKEMLPLLAKAFKMIDKKVSIKFWGDKIACELKDEYFSLDALKVAENLMKYYKTNKNTAQ